MSGEYLTLLLKAEDREDAISVANSELDEYFRTGMLLQDDKGYVVAEETPDKATKDDPAIYSAEENSDIFVGVLRDLEDRRLHLARYFIENAFRELKSAGVTLEQIVPEELLIGQEARDAGMAGYYLKKAGEIVGRYFATTAVLYNTESYEGGVTEKEIAEIHANPEGWWLVDVVVG